jgi:hypothetical protein
MPYTNPYFNSTYPGQTSEQSLIDDLVREQIKMYGLDILYMPRRHLNLDKLLHESSKNAFEFAMPIPMYLKTVDGFDNGMEVLTKFGVRSSDEVTFVMSRSEFTTYYSPYLKSYYNDINEEPPGSALDPLKGEIDSRPKEGDLIFLPFDNTIFEIKYVLFDQPFFQLGRGYVFEIQCEKFEYSGETFTTGYDDVDEAQRTTEYYRMNFDLMLSGDGTFEKGERVVMYDLTEADPMNIVDGKGRRILNEESDWVTGTPFYDDTFLELATEMDEALVTSDRMFFLSTDNTTVFRLYKDPGFVRRVMTTQATVMDWDITTGVLTLGDMDEIDPQQQDDYGDLTVNKHDTVLIYGQTSGARYVSQNAYTRPAYSNDEEIIQEEFDQIKILDLGDENPFGFV